jgi:hypothetical protein
MRGWNKYGDNKSNSNAMIYNDKTKCSSKNVYTTSYENNDNDTVNDDVCNKWFENVDGLGLDTGKERQERQNNCVNIGSYCNNCGKYGHLFSNCVVPITSIGIIACRKKTNILDLDLDLNLDYFDKYDVIDATVSNKIQTTTDSIDLSDSTNKSKNEFEYLMIQRVDSFGYIEFMRGKYSVHNYQFLKNIIDEMTIQEKHNILTKPFDELWILLWGEYSGLQYRGEKQVSKSKYLQLKSGVELGGVYYNLQSLITSSTTQWETAEWGFPKGRRNHQEKDIDCAFREFTEETGYSKEYLKQIFNIIPYEEIFIGSNMKCYKNKYFLSYMNSNIINTRGYQKSEVKNMKWLTYDECMKVIRPYNIEKKNMLTSINNTLHKFYICNI